MDKLFNVISTFLVAIVSTPTIFDSDGAFATDLMRHFGVSRRRVCDVSRRSRSGYGDRSALVI